MDGNCGCAQIARGDDVGVGAELQRRDIELVNGHEPPRALVMRVLLQSPPSQADGERNGDGRGGRRAVSKLISTVKLVALGGTSTRSRGTPPAGWWR